jgi:HK97 family phage major capsid protein
MRIPKLRHLSALFVLAVLTVASAIPVLCGVSPDTVAAGFGVILLSALFVERPRHSVRRETGWFLAQAGRVGGDDDEVKKEILEQIKKGKEELKTTTDAIAGQVDKIAAEQKAQGKVSEETKGEMIKLAEKNAELHSRLHELEQRAAQPPSRDPKKEKSNGARFVESDELKDFIKRGGKGHSAKFELKAITSVGGSAGAGIWSDRLAGVVEDPLQPVTVRQLLDNGTTGSNLIEWVRENVFTNNADTVSEGTLKPESNITYERVDVPVRTLAHFVVASKQVLSDFPMLQTLINGRLTQGLKIKEDSQLIDGDGTGENILGLVPQATAYDTGLNKTGDTRIDKIRHAILQVWKSFYPATGIVLHPADWEAIELTKDSQNRYLFSNPSTGAGPSLWGLPVAQSFSLAEGEFLVGSLKLAATVFDREQAGIFMSTEDRDNFVKNMVTILAEERLALAVSRPKAFVHGSF